MRAICVILFAMLMQLCSALTILPTGNTAPKPKSKFVYMGFDDIDDDDDDDGVPMGFTFSARRSSQSPLVQNHLAKAGGTFIRTTLEACLPEEHLKPEDEFTPVSDEDKHLFVVGSVRNPCEYALSSWAYFGGEKKSMAPVTKKLDTAEDVENFQKWVRYNSKNRTDLLGLESIRFAMKYINPHGDLFAMDGDNRDPFPQDVGRLDEKLHEQIQTALDRFDQNSVDCWLRTENVVGDLEKCLKEYEQKVGPVVLWDEFNRVVAGQGKHSRHRNPSGHPICNRFFDSDTAAFVLSVDKFIFNKFKYEGCCSDPVLSAIHTKTGRGHDHGHDHGHEKHHKSDNDHHHHHHNDHKRHHHHHNHHRPPSQ